MINRNHDLNLAVIGNCSINAMIDTYASVVFACWPRPDQDPLFSSLLHGGEVDSETVASFDIELVDQVGIEQKYLENTAILRTVLKDSHGNQVEVVDFAPRFLEENLRITPRAIVRIINPISGNASVKIRCNPRRDYNAESFQVQTKGNRIEYVPGSYQLVSNVPSEYVLEEKPLTLDQSYALMFGLDLESVENPLNQAKRWQNDTQVDWMSWVDSLSIPKAYDDAVIRSAIGLKLCWYEPTGALLAALTTGLPAENARDRNWDYRFCWIRDAFYTAEALHRLGDKGAIYSYREFLRPLLTKVSQSDIQCMYGVDGSELLTEKPVHSLTGYRGLGPILVGNKASEQTQLDCFGHILNIFAKLAIEEGRCSDHDLDLMVKTAEQAYNNYQKPDSGFWELRGTERTHTFSAIISWLAMRNMADLFSKLGDVENSALWNQRKDECRDVIFAHCWSDKEQAFAGFFGGDALDVTVLYMADIGMIDGDDPRLKLTIEAMERRLRKEDYLLPYDEEDDFGVRECGFNLCTFWFINSLHHIGRKDEAKQLFDTMLDARNDFGYLSEVIEPKTGEQWGNYPQAYSLMCIIETAGILAQGER